MRITKKQYEEIQVENEKNKREILLLRKEICRLEKEGLTAIVKKRLIKNFRIVRRIYLLYVDFLYNVKNNRKTKNSLIIKINKWNKKYWENRIWSDREKMSDGTRIIQMVNRKEFLKEK